MVLMIAAAVVILFLIFLILFVLVDLALLPGRVARQRGHPQADAVQVFGIIGLFTGVLWPLAVTWAYYDPSRGPGWKSSQQAELEARIASLEAKLTAATAGVEGAQS